MSIDLTQLSRAQIADKLFREHGSLTLPDREALHGELHQKFIEMSQEELRRQLGPVVITYYDPLGYDKEFLIKGDAPREILVAGDTAAWHERNRLMLKWGVEAGIPEGSFRAFLTKIHVLDALAPVEAPVVTGEVP